MTGLRFALDQNFPTKLIDALGPFLPVNITLTHVHKIDPRMSALSDRALIIALSQMGFDGLITTNHHMLDAPSEVAAMVATKSTMIIMKSMGHNMLRASGALFLELPGIEHRILPKSSNVFVLSYERRKPHDAWENMQMLAQRQGVSADALWDDVKPTADELTDPILG